MVTTKTTEDDRERFWTLVRRGGTYECWPYEGPSAFRATRGQVTPGQAAFELGGRVVPEGQVVYRKCGGHRCANPKHLGTTTPTRAGREMARIQREGPTCRVDGAPAPKPAKPRGSPDVREGAIEMREADDLRAALKAEGIRVDVMCVPEGGIDGLHVELVPGEALAWVPLKAMGRTKSSAATVAGVIARHLRGLREALEELERPVRSSSGA